MTQQQTKTKGVADIVFLIDATGSMGQCIDALKRNIETFIDFLSHGEGNQISPVQDWRAKVVGYRDFEEDQEPLVDNPFTRDAAELKSQLTRLHADGGGDLPESLLDALYVVANMGQMDSVGQSEDSDRWRPRSEAARVVVVFTDAPYKERMAIQEARGGGVQDIANALVQQRIILSLFAPDMPCYDLLSQVDKCEWEVIDAPGHSPQEALAAFTRDQANFRNTLKQLAASVSKSAETVAL